MIWKSIQINKQNVSRLSSYSSLIQMPHNSDFDGYSFWHTNKLIREGKHKNALCDYCKNKHVIIYCNYLDEVEKISSRIDCFTLIGESKAWERKRIIEQFKGVNKPLIMTYGVGSYSLNLQFCNEIVYSSLTFDYAKVEQSKYRIKRIGQEKDIKYTYFLSDLGINKLILENINCKCTLENLVKEKMMKGGLEWVKSI